MWEECAVAYLQARDANITIIFIIYFTCDNYLLRHSRAQPNVRHDSSVGVLVVTVRYLYCGPHSVSETVHFRFIGRYSVLSVQPASMRHGLF